MRRHSAGPIRQLSLQAEPPKSERRRPLVKQQSEDSSRLSVTAGPVRRPSPRPRPKLAWADRTSNESALITQQRPLVVRGSARASSATGPPRSLPNANTELFARLRRSWREHEHSRRNLNIFLAHAKVSGDDPDDLYTPRSDDEDEDRTRVILKDRSNIEDISRKNEVLIFCSTEKACPSPVPTTLSVSPEPSSPYSIAFSLSIQDETETDAQNSEKKIAIEIDVPRNLQSLTQESTNESKDECPPNLDILPNKFQTSTLSAAARRLNFKNSKTIQSTPVVEIQPAQVKSSHPPLLARSSSLQVPSPCPTPTKGILKDRRQLQPSVSFEEVDKIHSLPVLPRAKSAPVRKKVKVPQKKGRRCDSPEEEDVREEEKEKTANKNGRRTHRTPSDVITMVSLLSPTTSSDEATEIDASPSEADTAEANEPVPTATDPQAMANSPQTWDGTPSEFRTFYLRKPAKCVSFQGNLLPSAPPPPLSATATAAVAAASLAASTAASPLLGYSLTEKRAPSFVPTIAEPQTAKRRFIRTPDLTLDLHCPKDDPSNVASSDAETTPPPFCTTVANSDDQKEEKQQDDQPEFRTPKERECWALFRRMTDKGLPVSYDTVLRGLLTPTEYRLCRNSMLTEC